LIHDGGEIPRGRGWINPRCGVIGRGPHAIEQCRIPGESIQDIFERSNALAGEGDSAAQFFGTFSRAYKRARDDGTPVRIASFTTTPQPSYRLGSTSTSLPAMIPCAVPCPI
jgi:hypothetical protein